MSNYKFILLFLVLTTLKAHAGKAVVIVLEAPMMKDRTPDAKVVQLVRKNQVIWIRNREFGQSPLKPDYTVMNEQSSFDELKRIRYEQGESKAGYIETMDRNGGTAYIKKSYVKLIYKDDREYLTNVNPFIQDPMDYRLEEPLSRDYPLTDFHKKRAFFKMVFGPALKQSFQYANETLSSEQKFRKGIAFGYSGKVKWDKTDRFYFGGYGHMITSDASYVFDGNLLDDAEETFFQLSIGPSLSYDPYRSDNWKFSVGGGLNLNWTRNFVKLKDNLLGEEERLFQGFSITPRVFSNVHWRNFIIPDLDLVFGVDMQFSLAQTYTNNEQATLPALWERHDNPDAYTTPTGGVMTFMVGIQSSY